jgi:mediator of RNA polymerase II transcription subunit 17, fungi type
MGSLTGQFPISIRAWPPKDDNAVPLSSLISRINNERGGFREVSEESLIEELKRDEAGLDLSKDDQESEDEDAEEVSDQLKDLMKARGEILGQLE